MSGRSLTAALADFKASDATPRLVGGLFGVLPFAPPFPFRGTLASQAGDARVAAAAEELAMAPGPQAVLAVVDLLDKGDVAIALFSGVRAGMKAASGAGEALELDPQQAADAGLKAVGIAWAAWKLYGGDVRKLTSTETGRALLAWYVAADVVLPFADNLATGGVDAIAGAITGQAEAHVARLAPVAGSEASEALGSLAQLADTLKSGIGQAASYAAPMSAWVADRAPGILGTADKVSGIAATAADALSVYRYFGACLVAEAVLPEARRRVEAEDAAAREQAAEAGRAAQAAKAATAQREDYSLDAPLAAASVRNEPIKVTRSAESVPEKARGCMGCGAGVLLLALVGAGAGMWMA